MLGVFVTRRDRKEYILRHLKCRKVGGTVKSEGSLKK
jgi:hypothetical protein